MSMDFGVALGAGASASNKDVSGEGSFGFRVKGDDVSVGGDTGGGISTVEGPNLFVRGTAGINSDDGITGKRNINDGLFVKGSATLSLDMNSAETDRHYNSYGDYYSDDYCDCGDNTPAAGSTTTKLSGEVGFRVNSSSDTHQNISVFADSVQNSNSNDSYNAVGAKFEAKSEYKSLFLKGGVQTDGTDKGKPFFGAGVSVSISSL